MQQLRGVRCVIDAHVRSNGHPSNDVLHVRLLDVFSHSECLSYVDNHPYESDLWDLKKDV